MWPPGVRRVVSTRRTCVPAPRESMSQLPFRAASFSAPFGPAAIWQSPVQHDADLIPALLTLGAEGRDLTLGEGAHYLGFFDLRHRLIEMAHEHGEAQALGPEIGHHLRSLLAGRSHLRQFQASCGAPGSGGDALEVIDVVQVHIRDIAGGRAQCRGEQPGR